MPKEDTHHPLPSRQVPPAQQKKAVIPYTSTDAVRRTLQRRRYRKILFYHHVRRNLRQARAHDRLVSQRFWMTIASTFFALFFVFSSVTGTGAYTALRFYQ